MRLDLMLYLPPEREWILSVTLGIYVSQRNIPLLEHSSTALEQA
jgi:hypothetical protein